MAALWNTSAVDAVTASSVSAFHRRRTSGHSLHKCCFHGPDEASACPASPVDVMPYNRCNYQPACVSVTVDSTINVWVYVFSWSAQLITLSSVMSTLCADWIANLRLFCYHWSFPVSCLELNPRYWANGKIVV